MKIKYLKNAPQGMPGDVAEVPDLQANILIKLKFAEAFENESALEHLQNLNGTPVVDDFGDLVVVKTSTGDAIKEPSQEAEPKKPKATRARKAK